MLVRSLSLVKEIPEEYELVKEAKCPKCNWIKTSSFWSDSEDVKKANPIATRGGHSWNEGYICPKCGAKFYYRTGVTA